MYDFKVYFGSGNMLRYMQFEFIEIKDCSDEYFPYRLMTSQTRKQVFSVAVIFVCLFVVVVVVVAVVVVVVDKISWVFSGVCLVVVIVFFFWLLLLLLLLFKSDIFVHCIFCFHLFLCFPKLLPKYMYITKIFPFWNFSV